MTTLYSPCVDRMSTFFLFSFMEWAHCDAPICFKEKHYKEGPMYIWCIHIIVNDDEHGAPRRSASENTGAFWSDLKYTCVLRSPLCGHLAFLLFLICVSTSLDFEPSYSGFWISHWLWHNDQLSSCIAILPYNTFLFFIYSMFIIESK